MKKLFRFAILSVLFALCCVFSISSNNFIKVNANENISENTQEENVEENQEQVNELVDETTEELEKLIIVIIGIVSSLGISWGSLATVIKWIKKKLSKANTDLTSAYEMFEKMKEENALLREAIEKLTSIIENTNFEVQEVKNIQLDYFKVNKQKSEEINQVINNVLIENKDEEIKDESI